jgi:hypothetical protein
MSMDNEERLRSILNGAGCSDEQINAYAKKVEAEQDPKNDNLYSMLHAAGMSDAQIEQHRRGTGL